MKLRIRQIAKQKGMTMQDIADRLHISRQTLVNTIQLGNPTYKTMSKIADALDVPIWMLFVSPEEVLRDITIKVGEKQQ